MEEDKEQNIILRNVLKGDEMRIGGRRRTGLKLK